MKTACCGPSDGSTRRGSPAGQGGAGDRACGWLLMGTEFPSGEKKSFWN